MTAQPTPKLRFAPSPTGHLHVGNMRTALVNYLYAVGQGGQFMLRIDDTDTARSTLDYEQSIREDLHWMGLVWDVEDRQSSRLSHYDQALTHLIEAGRAYPCYETPEELNLKRKAQLMSGRPPVYDRAALKLKPAEQQRYIEEGRAPHYRFLLHHEDVVWHDLVRGQVSYNMSSLSDPVLMRADGRVIYTLASVVDDRDHQITTIIRGEDHVTNSAAQIQLFEVLGARPPEMGHLALLSGAEGEGLSKRLGSLSIADLRQEGVLPMALASLLSRIGTSQPILAQAEMAAIIAGFDLAHFGRATAKFSHIELKQINARLIQQLDFSDAKPSLTAAHLSAIDEAFWLAVRGNLSTIIEAGEWWQICTSPIDPLILDLDLTTKAASYLPPPPYDETSWATWTKAVSVATGIKGKALFMPLRQAITGRISGPDMARLLPFIHADRLHARLQGETA